MQDFEFGLLATIMVFCLALVLMQHSCFHFDVNGLVMEQQDDTTKRRRAQFAQTLSISHPIGRFTISGEVWHFAQPLTYSYAVGNLWSASYPIRKNLVIDAGFDHGFTSTSTDWRASSVLPISCPIDSGVKETVSIDAFRFT